MLVCAGGRTKSVYTQSWVDWKEHALEEKE